jgi:ADP-heptose:LPS heptosyltransferase
LNIVIIRACAVGDLILNLPALQALQVSYPEARFVLVGYPERLDIARRFIHVESVHSLETEPWSRLFYEPVKILNVDRALVWMKDPIVAENLRRSGIPGVSWFPPFPESGHAAAHLLNTLGLSAPELPDLWRPASDQVILHPGSGSLAKCWPHFRQLAYRLKSPAFLIGPAERDFDSGSYPRYEDLTLCEASDLLSRARAFVGNDSGITHLAGYLGCPTLALFGPTDPAVWGPVGRRIRILQRQPMAALEVESVAREFESFCGNVLAADQFGKSTCSLIQTRTRNQ